MIKMKGFICCSSLSPNFYCIFCLERRSQATTTPIWCPHQENFSNIWKFAITYQHTPTAPGHLVLLGASIPQNAWTMSLPAGWARQDQTPLSFPGKHRNVLHQKSLENWLSVGGVMTVFTASDSVCVLQVVCKKVETLCGARYRCI